MTDLLDRTDLAALAARFAARLRSEGLPVGPDRATRFAAAVAVADPQTVRELYWCGLATLVGFDSAANMAEEAKDPFRSVPRAIVGSVVAAALLGLNRDQIRYRIEKFKLERPA